MPPRKSYWANRSGLSTDEERMMINMRALYSKPERYLFISLVAVLVFAIAGCISDKGETNGETPTEDHELRPEHVVVIVAAITSFFALLIGSSIVWYFYSSRRSKERHEMIMALIEKGEYDADLLRDKEKYRKDDILLTGIIMIAIGIATAIGVPIAARKLEPLIAGLIPLFIGLGLITFYYSLSRREKSKSTKT